MIIKYMIFIIILYLYIYNPPFSFLGGLGSVKLLYLILFIVLLIYRKSVPRLLLFFKKERSYFIFLLFFSVLRFLIGGDVVETYKHLIFFIENYFLPIAIFTLIARSVTTDDVFLKLILLTGCVAAIISTVCIINPQVQSFVRYELQMVNMDTVLIYRGFGLGESLSFNYGITQGVLLGLGIINIKRYRWFIIFVPFFIASIILNARTGIFLSLAAIFCYMVFNVRKLRTWFSISIGGIIVLVIIVQLLNIYGLNDDQMSFIEDFSNQLTEAEEMGIRDNTGAIGALTTSHIVWPEGTEWFIGKGYQIFGVKGGHNSDIGFIQQLNYGGLIYFYALIMLIFCMIKRMMKFGVQKDIVVFFMLVIAIANYKGNFIINQGGFRLLVLVYFVLIYWSSYKKGIISNK